MTTFPPPTVPVFPAGYQPQQADFTAWWYDNLGFFQTKVVLRARQATAATSLPASGAITPIVYDTIDEDPFAGWSVSQNGWIPPAGYSGWYQVTITLFTNPVPTGAAIRALIGGSNSFDLATNPASSVHTGGAEGQSTVYLIGGQDLVRGSGSLLNSASAVTTSILGGQQSSMEIVWLGS